MCGFAGYYIFQREFNFDPISVLKSMGDQIAHRGPDDEQLFIKSNIGIIFRRLAIVDIQGGRQPITNEDETITLVVNGEIYNFRELLGKLKDKHHIKSKSDCEVLVHLYEEMGASFLNHINGMFALALYDQKNNIFLLARDRMGVKPLYYTRSNNRIIFSSEIKALFPFPNCPKGFNWPEALASLNQHYFEDEYNLETYFKEINQIKGGQYLMVKEGKNISLNTYWSIFKSLNNNAINENISLERCIEEYKDILKESVNSMLLGDVDIGIFLSGGIDSSSIAALAAKQIEIKSFSVFNEDTLESGDSEFGYRVANYLGIPNYQVKTVYNPDFHTPNFWKSLVWQCETFECGTEQLFKFELYKYIKNNFPSIKVVLIGQGSDEFNGGYTTKYIDNLKSTKLNQWDLFSNILENIEETKLINGVNPKLSGYNRYLNKEFLAKQSDTKIRENAWYSYINMNSKRLQMYQLLHEDRTAMANSIENRVPFLDNKLIDFLIRIPPKYFKVLFWNKEILRKSMMGHLALPFCNRPKVSFMFENKGHYSDKIILDIFLKNNEELLTYALGSRENQHEYLNRFEIDNLVKSLKSNDHFEGITDLRFLVNMGILERKLKEEIPSNNMINHKLELNNINAYNNRDKLDRINYRNEIKIFRHGKFKNININCLFLSNNIQILSDENGDGYIFKNNNLIEIISCKNRENQIWLKILKKALKCNNNISLATGKVRIGKTKFEAAINKSLKLKAIYIK